MIRFEDRSEEVFREILRKLEQAVSDTVDDIHEKAVNVVRVDTSPNKDDIVLRDSIKKEADGLTGAVYVEGAAEAYAKKQEYGDKENPRYGFTPYLRPAVYSTQNIFFNRVKDALK